MDYRENIKKVLNQKLKIEKVMPQNELAKALGINPSAITKWLNGERVPDIQNIPLVCELLNISLNQFFGINEDRVITQSELKYIETIEKHPELKAILDKYTNSN